jgi:cytoskeletal protein CcmA (bactofilin family)
MFNSSSSNGNKKKVEATQAVHTLLGKGTIWKGDIHSGPNSIRIEGTVEGTIHSEGEVTIAPSGMVKGTIHAKHLIVTGRVEGIFKISECLEIHGTGWVEGEVEVGSLVVDEGGTLQGACTRKGANKAKELETGKSKAADKSSDKGPDKTEDRFADRPSFHTTNGSASSTFEPAFAKASDEKGKA